ncbi:hypothetical protein DSECCO2_124280 [anaerobic digester metagenome]
MNHRTDQLLICCSLRHAKSALLLSHWSRAVANYKQACDWLVAYAQIGQALQCPLRCVQHDVTIVGTGLALLAIR